jgi:hypothetical protein
MPSWPPRLSSRSNALALTMPLDPVRGLERLRLRGGGGDRQFKRFAYGHVVVDILSFADAIEAAGPYVDALHVDVMDGRFTLHWG